MSLTLTGEETYNWLAALGPYVTLGCEPMALPVLATTTLYHVQVDPQSDDRMQMHLPVNDLFLPAGKTKAKKPRRVPISSALRAVMDARRRDPAGEPLPAEAFVFGDELGRRRWSIKTAWRLTCQRAKIADLHFHDLRREAGSRWMDAGVPLATIQRWLGHHNISQTSTYLAASGGGMPMLWPRSNARREGCRKLPHPPDRSHLNRHHPAA